MRKDLKYRNKFVSKELSYILSKSFFENSFLPYDVRLGMYDKMRGVGLLKSRIRNRCIVTGRSRGIVRGYRLSRAIFKEYVRCGKILGVSRRIF